jgi:hypothetical protein
MVYVFKTTVKSKAAVRRVALSLDKIACISKWNFDLQDCDHILRIEANEIDTSMICDALNAFGFNCILL